MKIRIVTDSSSDLSWEYVKENKIEMIPLNIFYDNNSYKENEKYDFDKHYKFYGTKKDFLPKTSQPSPKEFLVVFEKLADEGAEEIIVITISSQLSGTYNSARIASELLKNSKPKINVHLIDSKNASFAEGFLVEKAVSLIKSNKNITEIVKNLKDAVPNVKSVLILPTLYYLRKGGRISIAKYYLAKLLRKIALVKAGDDGTLQPVGAAGNLNEGLEKMVEFATDEGKKIPKKLAVVYATNFDLRDKLIALIKEKIPSAEWKMMQTRAAITAHVGPSTIALVSYYE